MSALSPFGVRNDRRAALFIDGPSFFATTRNLGYEVDYRSLLEHFANHSDLVQANYFTAITEAAETGAEYSPVMKLVQWLENNGYNVIDKPAIEFTTPDGKRRVKSNLFGEITGQMILSLNHVDDIVLFSGDDNFTQVVEALKTIGKRVIVVSSPTSISANLRTAAEARFVDLGAENVKSLIKSKRAPRETTA